MPNKKTAKKGVKKGSRGKRYDAQEKAKIVSWVNEYNANHNGRGGVANACKKFKVTQLTIKKWVDGAGGNRGPGRPAVAISKSKANALRRLADVLDAIAKKENELAKLQQEYIKLKKKI